jgi:hypothetical protein
MVRSGSQNFRQTNTSQIHPLTVHTAQLKEQLEEELTLKQEMLFKKTDGINKDMNALLERTKFNMTKTIFDEVSPHPTNKDRD